MNDLAKALIVLGVIMVLVGAGLLWAPKVPFLGHLPGDIYVRRENFSFYFPLATCLLVSVILTLFFWFFGKK